jgi:hypothetical protein
VKIFTENLEKFGSMEANFGGWAVVNRSLQIYVRDGLDLFDDDIRRQFEIKGPFGVGHCVMIFRDIEGFEVELFYRERRTPVDIKLGKEKIERMFVENLTPGLPSRGFDGVLVQPYAYTMWTVWGGRFELLLLD